MSDFTKPTLLPILWLGGTLENAVGGVAQTVGAVGQTALLTGTQGTVEVMGMWQSKNVHPVAAAVASPVVFVLGTLKGTILGVQRVVVAVGDTAVGTITGGVAACRRSTRREEEEN